MALGSEGELYIKNFFFFFGNQFHCISMSKIAGKLPLVTEQSVPILHLLPILCKVTFISHLVLRCTSLNYATDRTRQ